jgi:hypothetical protein
MPPNEQAAVNAPARTEPSHEFAEFIVHRWRVCAKFPHVAKDQESP